MLCKGSGHPEQLGKKRALNGESNYFQQIDTAINDKADKTTIYNTIVVNSLLDAKIRDADMANNPTTATTYTRTVIDNNSLA